MQQQSSDPFGAPQQNTVPNFQNAGQQAQAKPGFVPNPVFATQLQPTASQQYMMQSNMQNQFMGGGMMNQGMNTNANMGMAGQGGFGYGGQ